MITVYWFTNGVRVVEGTHEREFHSYENAVSRQFVDYDTALKELKPDNRAVPIIRYMRESIK